MLEVKEYQRKAISTCTPSSHNIVYMGFNLMGEVGEFFGKLAKKVRSEDVLIEHNDYVNLMGEDEKDDFEYDLRSELGDIIWQAFGLADAMGWDAEEICKQNLLKLARRKSEGTIVGSGDGATKAEGRVSNATH